MQNQDANELKMKFDLSTDFSIRIEQTIQYLA